MLSSMLIMNRESKAQNKFGNEERKKKNNQNTYIVFRHGMEKMFNEMQNNNNEKKSIR